MSPHLGGSPDSVVWLYCYQFARVVLPDGDLAGGGAVPAADLEDHVRGLDEPPDCSVGVLLHSTVGPDKVLCEEIALLV